MENQQIVIVGAGPAGATLALFLAKKKIPHVLIDKAVFPRDKTCGDALTPEVPRILRELDENWYQEFLSAPWVQPSSSMTLSKGNSKPLVLKFKQNELPLPINFVAKREAFDNWLCSKLNLEFTDFRQNTSVTSIERKDGKVILLCTNENESYQICCSLVIGADGERSIVRKTFHPDGIKKNRQHHAASIRVYFENVLPYSPENPLEFYVPIKNIPCYLWVFPLPNGAANVGLGALSNDVSRLKLNLKEILFNFLKTHPELSCRFKNATATEEPKGWGIPFNSDAHQYYGDQFLLIGDSAKFAEPLTAKGIGIALFAAKLALPTIEKAIKTNDFSAKTLQLYEKDIEQKFRKEWDLLYRLHRLAGYNRLLNLFLFFLRLKPINRWLSNKLSATYLRFINNVGSR